MKSAYVNAIMISIALFMLQNKGFAQLQGAGSSVRARIVGSTLYIDGTNSNETVTVYTAWGSFPEVKSAGKVVAISGLKSGTTINAVVAHVYQGDDYFDASSARVPVKINGGQGADYIIGSSSSDQIFGDRGNDTLFGGAGDDQLFGGDGSDLIRAGQGNDAVAGDDGDDVLYGDLGFDTVNTGAGNDSVFLGEPTTLSGVGKRYDNVYMKTRDFRLDANNPGWRR